MFLRCLCLTNEKFDYNVLGERCLVQTISAEYGSVYRDAAYWMVGASMAPLYDFGYLPRLAQQNLQGSWVYMRISGPPYKGGGPNSWVYSWLLDSTTFSWRINPSALQVQVAAGRYNFSAGVPSMVEHRLVLCCL